MIRQFDLDAIETFPLEVKLSKTKGRWSWSFYLMDVPVLSNRDYSTKHGAKRGFMRWCANIGGHALRIYIHSEYYDESWPCDTKMINFWG
jgi:hypothetical protein